ncbi:hypothetical protein HMPREF0653_02181, partial [Prevotella disiens JCM 6334 = ATCC 29426]
CGTLGVNKRYLISVLILLFAISVQNTAYMRKRYTPASAFSCYFIIFFDLVLV